VSPAELETVKKFLRLPKDASYNDVEAVAATHTHKYREAERKKRSAPALPPAVPKKITIKTFFLAKDADSPLHHAHTATSDEGTGTCCACAKQDQVRIKTKVVTRKSIRQKAGDSALKKLLETHAWRNQNNNASKADDQLLQMVRECKLPRSDGKVKDNVKELRAKVKIMEETMMSGDVVWAQQALVRFLSRASVMEIRKSCPVLFEATKRTKEERVQDMFVQQIRDFVTIITETKVPAPPPPTFFFSHFRICLQHETLSIVFPCEPLLLSHRESAPNQIKMPSTVFWQLLYTLLFLGWGWDAQFKTCLGYPGNKLFEL
jgi:hypothetical protein